MSEKGQSIRILIVAAMVVMMLGGLGVRLAFLHLGPDEELRSRIERARHSQQILVAGRGRVLDCNGNLLALDLAVKDVWADPKVILENGQMDFIAMHLARILQLDPAMVSSRLNRPDRRYEYIKRFVPRDVADQISRMQFHGVHFDDTSARHYPQGSLLAHVIGFSNLEGVGSAGVEQSMNRYLRGRPGWRVSERDGKQSEIYSRRVLDIEPEVGADVHLTIDQNIQFIMEEALDQAAQKYGGQGIWAMMMRTRTGEIMAMASRPTYDLNAYRTSTEEERRNRNISMNFEPGSTFKVAVIAAALNERVVTPNQVFDCEGGTWFFRGRPLRDYRPHGRLTVSDILKKSSNIGAAKIALELGEAKLEKYLRDFGFGQTTGIDLPGEEAGILSRRQQWSAISITRIAMGHEVAVTSLQMLNSVNAIANDGFLMRPYVVKRIVDVNGRVLHETEPQVLGRPIREDTARLMRHLLSRSTEEGGTARSAAMDGYLVGGKTGTAQKPIPGGYSDRLNIASFVGFLPAHEPEYSLIVVVDEPWPLRTGGAVAAPIFKDISEEVVRYLAIPRPDRTTFGRLAAPGSAGGAT